MMIFADSNPFGAFTGDQLMVWLACGWAVLAGFDKGTSLWGKWTGKVPLGTPNNPTHTRQADRSPSWAEWASMEKRVEKVEVAMQEMQERADRRADKLLKSQIDEAGKIHTRVNEILAAVSRLEGRIEK